MKVHIIVTNSVTAPLEFAPCPPFRFKENAEEQANWWNNRLSISEKEEKKIYKVITFESVEG